MGKVALITGITGQDGSFLAELLLEKGYEVWGLVRASLTEKFERIEHIRDKLHLRQGDLMDEISLFQIIEEAQPDEIYNLAAQSFIPTSWEKPLLTGEVTALGAVRIIEAIRRFKPDVRFYQASSSEMFGDIKISPQDETTPFFPTTPYGVAKLYAHFITVNFRKTTGMYACSGILYNHESERRGKEFVTRKITHTAAKIKLGLTNELVLGNLDAKRDWGYAGDYVEAMWLMLNQDKPSDYVIGTGKLHSVREFVEIAFGYLDLDYKKYVKQNKKFLRPLDPTVLVANPEKARKELNWQPKVSFEELVKLMVKYDYETLKNRESGYISENRSRSGRLGTVSENERA